MIQLPPGVPDYLRSMAALLNAELLRREPIIVGTRDDGTNLYVRFVAAYTTPWVQAHVQTSAAGEGGSSYDPEHYKSSTEIDCAGERVQEFSTPDVSPETYYIWLVPKQRDGAGNKVMYDGESGRPDNMAYLSH